MPASDYELPFRAQPLTKDVPFEFSDEHRAAMEYLKTTIVTSPALHSIDYNSALPVILTVDTSNIAVSYILMQEDKGGKRYPAHFSSITLNNRILLFDFKLVHIPTTKHTVPDGLSRRPKAKEDPKVDKEEYEDWVDECGAFAIELMNHREPKSRLLCPPKIPPSEYYSPNALPQDLAIFTTTEILPETSETEIPRSEKARQRDERLEVVREFLEMKKLPDGLEEKELDGLVQLAT
ncbi:hypothetical protein PISMIDRAFT_19170 [Pisolithus microcarpus 441]|uniref:Reverse transcriptase/retrotransposon-derived protein RNase H-like domain-containing protein n=1 Tax=Pisolithus microcarpus 441 TaxID=765257 RepID=A0A0C9YDI5_9AGAM|nr:hypothetical protein PISMIDRAFT_19170 [Pisolithus microcarpus 441]